MSLSIKKGKTLTGSGKYANVWWIYKNGNRIGYANTKKLAEQVLEELKSDEYPMFDPKEFDLTEKEMYESYEDWANQITNEGEKK